MDMKLVVPTATCVLAVVIALMIAYSDMSLDLTNFFASRLTPNWPTKSENRASIYGLFIHSILAVAVIILLWALLLPQVGLCGHVHLPEVGQYPTLTSSAPM